jgi:ankyrin repeat protein
MTDRERYCRFQAIDRAYRDGDMAALRHALGDPEDFPNCSQPFELAAGDRPLEYAVDWSPRAFVAELLAAGADPNHPDPGGFPALIAALSSERGDRLEILKLLLDHGADPDQPGINDWTPLHYAVARRDMQAIGLLLDHGADPEARTRIDDYITPLEAAESGGFNDGAAALRGHLAKRTAP